jgi:hypothetical protein
VIISVRIEGLERLTRSLTDGAQARAQDFAAVLELSAPRPAPLDLLTPIPPLDPTPADETMIPRRRQRR